MSVPAVVYVVLALDDPFSHTADVVVNSVWTEREAAERHAETVRGWMEEHELRCVCP